MNFLYLMLRLFYLVYLFLLLCNDDYGSSLFAVVYDFLRLENLIELLIFHFLLLLIQRYILFLVLPYCHHLYSSSFANYLFHYLLNLFYFLMFQYYYLFHLIEFLENEFRFLVFQPRHPPILNPLPNFLYSNYNYLILF